MTPLRHATFAQCRIGVACTPISGRAKAASPLRACEARGHQLSGHLTIRIRGRKGCRWNGATRGLTPIPNAYGPPLFPSGDLDQHLSVGDGRGQPVVSLDATAERGGRGRVEGWRSGFEAKRCSRTEIIYSVRVRSFIKAIRLARLCRSASRMTESFLVGPTGFCRTETLRKLPKAP